MFPKNELWYRLATSGIKHYLKKKKKTHIFFLTPNQRIRMTLTNGPFSPIRPKLILKLLKYVRFSTLLLKWNMKSWISSIQIFQKNGNCLCSSFKSYGNQYIESLTSCTRIYIRLKIQYVKTCKNYVLFTHFVIFRQTLVVITCGFALVNPIKAIVSRVCVRVSVCISQFIGTRERKKQQIQINKISQYKYHLRTYRYVT